MNTIYRFLTEDDTSAFCHKVSAALAAGFFLLARKFLARTRLHILELDAWTRVLLIVVGAFVLGTLLVGGGIRSGLSGRHPPAPERRWRRAAIAAAAVAAVGWSTSADPVVPPLAWRWVSQWRQTFRQAGQNRPATRSGRHRRRSPARWLRPALSHSGQPHVDRPPPERREVPWRSP